MGMAVAIVGGVSLVLIVAVIAVVAIGVGGFNKLRRLDVKSSEALSGIDVQLTRRADLIPNLVNTVKGYAEHEKGVFDAVTKARAGISEATQSGTVEQKAQAQAAMDKAMVNVMAVAENYPELKASSGFQQLQGQLSETENQLAFARQFYNDAVSQLNQAATTLPTMLFANAAGVREREFYQAPADTYTPPAVEF